MKGRAFKQRVLEQRPPADRLSGTHGNARPTHLLVHDLAYPIGQDPLVIGGRPDKGTRTIPLTGSSDGNR